MKNHKKHKDPTLLDVCIMLAIAVAVGMGLSRHQNKRESDISKAAADTKAQLEMTEQKLLIFIMCGSLVQNVGYLLELTAPTVEAAMAGIKVENVGSAFAPLCYCWFIYIYCYATPPKTLLRTLTAISFFVLPTVRLGPFRVRAFCLVFCPRTGNPLR